MLESIGGQKQIFRKLAILHTIYLPFSAHAQKRSENSCTAANFQNLVVKNTAFYYEESF